VIIKNVDKEKYDEDTLDLYFTSKKKSGVETYKTVQMLADDTIVVDFGDEKCMYPCQCGSGGNSFNDAI